MFYLGFITEISLKFQRWIFPWVQYHLQCFCEAFPFCCWRSSLRHPFSPAAAMRNAGRHSRSAQGPSLFPSSLPQARKQYWAWAQANQLHGGGQMRQDGGWADTTEPCWKNGAQNTCCAEASPTSNHIFSARRWGAICGNSCLVLFWHNFVLFRCIFYALAVMSHLEAWALNLTCLKKHCSIPFCTPSSLLCRSSPPFFLLASLIFYRDEKLFYIVQERIFLYFLELFNRVCF